MEKEFIPYDLALELKDLGFDEECFGWYNMSQDSLCFFGDDCCADMYAGEKLRPEAPLWQQAFDWFRYVMLLDNFITPYWFIDGEYKAKKYIYSIEPSNRYDEYFDCYSDQYCTYEEAEIECLKKLIEITKEQNVK